MSENTEREERENGGRRRRQGGLSRDTSSSTQQEVGVHLGVFLKSVTVSHKHSYQLKGPQAPVRRRGKGNRRETAVNTTERKKNLRYSGMKAKPVLHHSAVACVKHA